MGGRLAKLARKRNYRNGPRKAQSNASIARNRFREAKVGLHLELENGIYFENSKKSKKKSKQKSNKKSNKKNQKKFKNSKKKFKKKIQKKCQYIAQTLKQILQKKN